MPRSAVAAAVAAALAAAGWGAGAARADSQLQATVDTTAGVSTNVLGVPSDSPAGARGPETDAFATVTPGVLYGVRRPRAVYRLSYHLDYTAYVSHSEANTYANRVLAVGAFNPSPRTDLSMSLGATQGKVSAFDTALPGAENQPAPGGVSSYVSVSAGGSFGFTVSPVWRTDEGLSATYLRQDSGAATLESNLTASAERSWRHDAVALTLRLGDVGAYPVAMEGSADVGSSHILLQGLESRWRHDFDLRWTGEARLGLIALEQASDLGNVAGPAPSGGLQVRNAGRYVNTTASYSYSTRANLFTSGTERVHDVSVGADAALGWIHKDLSASGAIGYQHGRAIALVAGDPAPASDLFHAELGVNFVWREAVTGRLRYEVTDQRTDVSGGGRSEILRHMISLTVGAYYPLRAPAELPLRTPLRTLDDGEATGWDADPDRRPTGADEPLR